MSDATNPKLPNQSRSNDPYLGDELDVLEAVAKLEKKYGKEILTAEQRNKLVTAGRVSKSREAKKYSLEEVAKVVNLIVEGMKEDLFEARMKQSPDVKWDTLPESLKEGLACDYFRFIHGMGPLAMKRYLLQGIYG